MKIQQAIIAIILSALIVISCKSDEERFWDSVEINQNTNSFAFVFTSNNIAFAGDYASSIIERVKTNKVGNVSTNKVVFLSFYPSVFDTLYNPTAEKLFFDYDASGNNTFTNYPAFVNNTEMFNFDTTAFYQSISDKSVSVTKVFLKNTHWPFIYMKKKKLHNKKPPVVKW
jgi:hypothetical protein